MSGTSGTDLRQEGREPDENGVAAARRHVPGPLSVVVCVAVVALLVTAVIASIVIVVLGDPGHSAEWKVGYNDSWEEAGKAASASPPPGLDRALAVADCSAAVAAHRAQAKPHAHGSDYWAGWTKGCEDFLLTDHKNPS